MALNFVLLDVRLFDNKWETKESRDGLLWLLEALSNWNRAYLKLHPETPKLYRLFKEGKVKYKKPEQFERDEKSPLASIAALVKRHGGAKEENDLARIAQMIGGEHFRDVPAFIENGGGDCDNIACIRVAELRNLGVAAMPYLTWRRRPDGGMTYHALVRWPDGSSEDPSLLLGMGGESRTKERAEEVRKNTERQQMAQASVAVKSLDKAGAFKPVPAPHRDDDDFQDFLDFPDESEVNWS